MQNDHSNQAQTPIKHLNRILRATRDINQLIVREKDRQRLVQRACELLVEARNYEGVWIVLTDELPAHVTAAQAGLPEAAFASLIERVERGELFPCSHFAQIANATILAETVSTACGEVATLTACLTHDGQTYGWLGVAVPSPRSDAPFADDPGEKTLLRGIADDLAFALHAIASDAQRRRNEEALRESQAEFQALFESSPLAIAVYTADGRFLHCNQAMIDLLGYPAEELATSDPTFPDDRDAGRDLFQRLASGDLERYQRQKRYQCRDGRVIWTQLTATRICDADGNLRYLMLINEDITARVQTERERRQAEESLRLLSARQQALVAAIPDIIVEVDHNQVYTWANQAGIAFFGEDVLGKAVAFYFEGEQDPYGVIQPPSSGDEDVLYLESWQRRKDGEKRLLSWWRRVLRDDSGNVTGALSSARDVTERVRSDEKRRRAENEAAQAARKWQTTFDATHDVMWVLDREQRVLRANEATAQLFQCAGEALIGKHCWEIVHGTAQPTPECPILRAKTSLRRETTELPIGAGWFQVAVDPILDAAGQYTGAVHIIHDITQRKHAEEALRESEERFRTLFEKAGVGIALMDVDSAGLIQCNPALSRMLGYSEDELRGLSIRDTTYPDDLAADLDLWREMQKGKCDFYTLEKRYYHKDGHLVWGSLTVTLVRDATGKPLYAISMVEDTSERKRAEDMLRWAEERYRRLFEEAPAMYVITHNHEDAPIIVDCNRTFLRTLGYARDQVIGRPLADLYTSRSRAELLQDGGYRRALEGHFVAEERQFLTRDGRVVETLLRALPETDIEGNVTGTRAMYVDITARKQAEEALAVERSLLRTLVDHLPVAVYVKDATGRKTLANPADFHNMGAASEVEVLGKTDFELFPPDMAARFDADDRHVIQSGQPILNREEEVTRPDGTRGWQLTSKVPVRDSTDQVIGLVGIGHDITARKRAEEALKTYSERLEDLVAARTRALEEAQERLLRQERLTVLGQVAGGIAHELRNPLGTIKNAAYLLNLLCPSPDPEIKETLDIMNQEIGTADRIIRSLLNFTRPRRPARQVVDVGQAVEHALQRMDVPPDVQVEQYITDALPPILADASQLEQVWGNLILNAVQAMPAGGRLTIRARRAASPPDVAEPGFMPEHTEAPVDGWIVVSIADTGLGIAPEHLARVFEPLFTTKSTGIGLGLALVRLLIQANGGGGAVKSIPGQGATFDTFWPVARP